MTAASGGSSTFQRVNDSRADPEVNAMVVLSLLEARYSCSLVPTRLFLLASQNTHTITHSPVALLSICAMHLLLLSLATKGISFVLFVVQRFQLLWLCGSSEVHSERPPGLS